MNGAKLSAALERPVCLLCRGARPQSLLSPVVTRTYLSPFSSAPRKLAIAGDELPPRIVDQFPVASVEDLGMTQTRINNGDKSALSNLRVVPASPAYFSAKPVFTDALLELQALLRKYIALPVLPPGHAPRVSWKSLVQVRSMLGGEGIKSMRYHKIVRLLQRLNYIHPTLMPEDVAVKLKEYMKDVQPHDIKRKPVIVDEFGRAKGVGRRKTSSAVVWLVEGEGEVLVNGKTLPQFFGRLHDRESAMWALKATQRIDKYNVFGLVKGGGVSGQAEALTLAVGHALMVHEPALKPALRRGEFIVPTPCWSLRKPRSLIATT